MYLINHNIILIIFIINVNIQEIRATNCSLDNASFEIDGNVTLRVMVDGHSGDNCERSLALGRTQTASIAWIIQRLNDLQYLNPITIGLKIFDICSNPRLRLNTFLELFLNDTKCDKNGNFQLPVITTHDIANGINPLPKMFNIPLMEINANFDYILLVDTTIQFIVAMNFNREIVLITDTEEIEEYFNNAAKEEWLCVKNFYKIRDIREKHVDSDDMIVIFGNKEEILKILSRNIVTKLKVTWIFVPVDGFAEFEGTPNNSYIILPAYADYYQTMKQYLKLTPSPILLNTALPILTLVNNIRTTKEQFCNSDTDLTTLLNCLHQHRNNYQKHEVDYTLSNYNILETLKIEQIYDKFYFEIYAISEDFIVQYMQKRNVKHLESQSFINDIVTMHKIAAFNIFNRTLMYDQTHIKNGTKQFCKLSHIQCLTHCRNFNKFREKIHTPGDNESDNVNKRNYDEVAVTIRWRNDAWIAALISISGIGFLSALAVLMFILIRICKGDILEGNPTGSILLLITIMLMYLSIVPFSIVLETDVTTTEFGEPSFEYVLQDQENLSTTNMEGTENSTGVGLGDSLEKVNLTYVYENTTEINFHATSENITENLLEFGENTTQLYIENTTNTTDFITGDNFTFSNVVTSTPTIELNSTVYNTTDYEYKNVTDATTPMPSINSINVRHIIHFINNSQTFTFVEKDDEFPVTTAPKVVFFGRGPFQSAVCSYTVFSISILYTFAFSLMLSRFVMVASVGHEGGFMSHVNGYIQTTLCFFMVIAQIGLSLELWLIYHDCTTIFGGNFIVILLSYDIFLLVLLVCITPFIVRSQRNYKEGIMFTVAIYLICVIWVIWITIYSLVTMEWKDVLLASGVVATATILLVSVFIPRTYLMMTGIVRDHLANALPSLAHTQSTSVLDVNFRNSSQAIYDCVNPVAISTVLRNGGEPGTIALHGGQTNPNYYSEAPGGECVIEERNNFDDENTYERYDTPPSPNKVTRF